MKKRKKNHSRLWTIGVMVIFLLAAPSGWAEDYNGGTHYVIEDVEFMNIWPDTTVNLYASVSQYVFVAPGSTLNIYSGNVSWLITISTDEPDADVTVYGSDFKVDWKCDGTIVSLNGATEFTPLSTPTYDSGSILLGTYGNGDSINLLFFSHIPIHLRPPVSDDVEVMIDIKPGSDENVINLKSKGVVPVAVLTTDEFNADTLVPDYSISFAGASPVHSTLCDVDDDGDMDMLFHFRTQELDLNETSTEAELMGTLKSAVTKSSSSAADEDVIRGTDIVKVKSSRKK